MPPILRIPDAPGYINNLPVCKNASCNLYQTLVVSNAELAKRLKELEDIEADCDKAYQHVLLIQKDVEELTSSMNGLKREIVEKEAFISKQDCQLTIFQKEIDSMRRVKIGPQWFKNLLDRFGLEMVRRP